MEIKMVKESEEQNSPVYWVDNIKLKIGDGIRFGFGFGLGIFLWMVLLMLVASIGIKSIADIIF